MTGHFVDERFLWHFPWTD